MSKATRIFFIVALMLAFTGCKEDKATQELTKWKLTLHKDDRRAYGTYLAYQSMAYYFPYARIEALPDGFRYNNIDARMMRNASGHSLMVLQGLDFYLSEEEWSALKHFIRNGNEVVVFCRVLDSKIEEEFHYYKRQEGEEEEPLLQASANGRDKDVLSLAAHPQKKYGYEGRTLRGYFMRWLSSDTTTKIAPRKIRREENEDDSSTVDQVRVDDILTGDTLGYANGRVDFIRFAIGNGHLTLHAAPLVLSNYFLLRPGNTEYLSAIWNTLPPDINRIYWNDYYKRSSETSGLDVLWRYKSTRLALQLALLVLLVYVLFEAKRKQRIIPVIAPLRNDSVSFVETVGRLYYNKGNHANLAAKMTQQFLEWVRMHYFLNTNLLNEDFIRQLVIKSGQQEVVVRELMGMIHEIKLGGAKIDDPYLYKLYNTIQQFYKNKHT